MQRANENDHKNSRVRRSTVDRNKKGAGIEPSKSLHIGSWVVQALLSLTAMIPWAGQVPEAFLQATAVVDLLSGLGVLLPSLTRIQPGLSAYAAVWLRGPSELRDRLSPLARRGRKHAVQLRPSSALDLRRRGTRDCPKPRVGGRAGPAPDGVDILRPRAWTGEHAIANKRSSPALCDCNPQSNKLQIPRANENCTATRIAACVDRDAPVPNCPCRQSPRPPTALPPTPGTRHAAPSAVFAQPARARRVCGLAAGIHRRFAAVVSRRTLRRAGRSSSFADRGRRQPVPFARHDWFNRSPRARLQPRVRAARLHLERTFSRTRTSNATGSSSLSCLCFDESQEACTELRPAGGARCMLIGAVVHGVEASSGIGPASFARRRAARGAASDLAVMHGLEATRPHRGARVA